MENLHLPLSYEKYYHIYNRGIDGVNLFRNPKNYAFFLQKYALYMNDVVNTYAYCLLGNHFHLLISVKQKSVLDTFMRKKGNGLHSSEHIVSKQFAKLFSSYTQSFNKIYGRTGSLFETPFKRKEVTSDDYFTRLIAYIHQNPQKHGLIDDFKEYPYSSYMSFLSEKETKLQRKEVLDWFDGKDKYVESQILWEEGESRWRIE